MTGTVTANDSNLIPISLEPSPDLLAPPASPEANTGTEAESLIAKLLKADGFQVAFYTNRRGFGFDIWAKKADMAIVVEVKSSVADMSTITLTRLEHEAAKQYGNSFVLALVDQLGTGTPRVRWIQNPFSKLSISCFKVVQYTVNKSDWEKHATQSL